MSLRRRLPARSASLRASAWWPKLPPSRMIVLREPVWTRSPSNGDPFSPRFSSRNEKSRRFHRYVPVRRKRVRIADVSSSGLRASHATARSHNCLMPTPGPMACLSICAESIKTVASGVPGSGSTEERQWWSINEVFYQLFYHIWLQCDRIIYQDKWNK